jgi:hypothetical protein
MNYIKYFLIFFQTEDCLLNVNKKVKNKFYLKENFQYIKNFVTNFKLVTQTIRWRTIANILIFGVILLNFFLTTTIADLERLFILSVFVGFFYVCQTGIWKFKSFILYMLGSMFLLYLEKSLLFVYFNISTILLLLWYIYQPTKERDYYVHMIVLNTLFLSIFFVVFKYFLLKNSVLLTKFLDFSLNYETSKIALNVTFAGIYTPYPEGQYKIWLNIGGYQEELRFLAKDWDNLSIDLVGSLFWFCYTTEKLLPFLEITLIISN